MTRADHIERPGLSLRVGVSGLLELDVGARARIERDVRQALETIAGTIADLCLNSDVIASYASDPDATLTAKCRFISPLALGADRLAATEALAQKFTLYVPMPFAQSEYETCFTTSVDVQAFRDLLARADEGSLELDGAHGALAPRSYEAVGRLVVRQSDILIAIWDGKPGHGRGGTSDIVRFAAAQRVPVIWISADEDRPPRWIGEMLDLTHPSVAATPYESAVRIYLNQLIVPPKSTRPHSHTAIDWCAQAVRWLRDQSGVSPLQHHFLEQKRPDQPYWRAYAVLMAWFGGKADPWKPGSAPELSIARYWHDRYRAPNARANETAARYRSTYVLVFVLATLSLIFGASELLLGFLTPVQWGLNLSAMVSVALTIGELLSLVLIFVLVITAKACDWHEKSIEYRLLAELYRKQQALAPLGWALPITAVRSLVSDTGQKDPDRAAWVAWLFAAEQRAAPFQTGKLAEIARDKPHVAIRSELIEGQLAYHKSRERLTERASLKLEKWGSRVFGGVTGFTVAKLLLAFAGEHPFLTVPIAWLATVLPGISAALVGIRSYAELPMLAAQSRHMVADLEAAERRVDRIDMTRPLASQDLGYEAATVATIMLQDLEGWARLFRLKGAELG